MTKTLKQILAEHYTVFEYDQIELAVIEWLTQKQQQLTTPPWNYHIAHTRKTQLQELIEELQK